MEKIKQTLFNIISKGGLIILYAIILHFSWAVIVLFNSQALMVTPFAGIIKIIGFNELVIALILLTTAGLALYSLLYNKHKMIFLLPQQLLLLLSAVGSAQAIHLQQYADGVVRSMAFIGADQFPNILIALVHSIALLKWVNIIEDKE